VTSELQQNRYDRLIRRVGGIIGVGSKVSEVLTELFPMIDVEGDRGELQLISGTALGMGGQVKSGASGETAKIQLFNPVDSGKLITVTDIFIAADATQNIFLSRTTILLSSGVGTQLPRDTRQSLTDRPVGAIFSESSVPFADAHMQIRLIASTTFHMHATNDLMVLSPGNGMTVGSGIAQSTFRVSFLWRERAAEQSELNF